MNTVSSQNTAVIHLTETGVNAGRRLCGSDRGDGEQNAHAVYAPLEDPKFRDQVCRLCLTVWAQEAFDEGEEMPDYIREIRSSTTGSS